MASKPEFAARLATYNMDDDDTEIDWNDKGNITDWFSFDFDLAELQTLRKRQTNDFRNPEFDWQESVVTLEELVGIVKEEGEVQGRSIGIYPEIKHPHAINRILASRGVEELLEELVLAELARLGLSSASDPVYLQSFELTSLEHLRRSSELRLVFLTERNLTAADWARIDGLGLAGEVPWCPGALQAWGWTRAGWSPLATPTPWPGAGAGGAGPLPSYNRCQLATPV